MGMSFVTPHYLWLLLLLVPVVALGWFNGRRFQRSRLIGSLLLRSLLLITLIGSLAGAQIISPVKQLTTIFLIDTSDSITPNQRSQQDQFIADALQTMPKDDQAAIIVFGQNALIERLPSEVRTLSRIQSVPIAARTDLEQAMTLSFALFPADTQKRVVLLSDGGENSGQALKALELAQDRQIVVDVVTVEQMGGAEVAITALRMPGQARIGQELQIVAQIDSNEAQDATIRILIDRELYAEEALALPKGTLEYTSTVVLNDQGFHKVSAQIIPTNDIRKQNNEATALVNLQGPPKILVVANEPADAENIAPALEAANLQVTVVGPTGLPTTLADLADYEAVILANVPERLVADESQQALQTFVRDLGRGFVMIGGENSYGIGGYASTPIEELLPVEMQLRNREKYPPVSVAVVFDISGSMSEQVGGRQKVTLASEGAARVVQLLRDFDEITVLPFDSAVQNQYGPVAGSEREVAQGEIIARGVTGGGGINVHDSLVAAGSVLKGRDAPIRHIILLADGSDSQQQENAVRLTDEHRRLGITTSTIAIGNGGDVGFLNNVAIAGGGRHFLVENALALPDIVLQDAQLSLAPYIVEKSFLPLLGSDSVIMANLNTANWPQLLGYNGTMAKDNANMVLWADEDAPLLAQWQYGLGRSVAWMSDMKGKWGTNLTRWDQFPRLIAQMVGWTLPVISNETISVNASFVGPEMEVTLVARDPNDTPITGLIVDGNVVNDGGSQASISLVEVSAGIYQGRINSPGAGTYFLQLAGRNGEGQAVFQETAGVIVPYSPEYRQGQSNPNLLSTIAQRSQGRVLTDPTTVFEHSLELVTRATPIHFNLLLAALLLLLLDIAVRRLRFGQLSKVWAGMGRRQAAPSQTMGDLAAAKQRARTKMGQTTPEPSPIATKQAPVYKPGANYTPPAAQAKPEAASAVPPPAKPSTPAPTPTQGPPPKQTNLDEITDPLERLRAAKNRARRQ
ncbi:VWA domain-containing protein [Herpetosiphon giganteus]|uniref:VWA domain-containing protein n=1 Tax=Herpetosiphon giganteus TaxID=2029754 RepID=UPI001957CA26|nr:VWA domain-containing protein [Herpetosiphon giganteus]MBM7845098.1 putative membrane protein/CheY-like chemotaxis protein [Herpetosiphon giganteus]